VPTLDHAVLSRHVLVDQERQRGKALGDAKPRAADDGRTPAYSGKSRCVRKFVI
jgi:hypothetical protein